MNDAEKKTRQLAAWWKVMQEACNAMTAYIELLDRTDITEADRDRMGAELVAKANRLKQQADDIVSKDSEE